VAEWQSLPPDARAALPTAEELEAVVQDELAQMALSAGADATSPIHQQAADKLDQSSQDG